jgi:beta-ribofuranosylaminobenzene 5'-phosphate synthase
LEGLQSQLMTAATDHDFSSFSQLLTSFGRQVGEYFVPFQTGIFASGRMAALAQTMPRHGIGGVGQTSWGPTLFAACESSATAVELVERIHRWKDYSDCTISIVAAKNCGATIMTG